jgi:DNA-binding NtrC family response regulator
MKIFVIEDDDDYRNKECSYLRQKGYEVLEANGEKDAREILAKEAKDIGIALVDLTLEERHSGLKLIEFMKEKYPYIVPIVVTGLEDTETAIHCLSQRKAFDYIIKAKMNPNYLLQIIEKAKEYVD